jgi:hypothetical protein
MSGKETWHKFNKRFGATQSRFGRFGEEKISCPYWIRKPDRPGRSLATLLPLLAAQTTSGNHGNRARLPQRVPHREHRNDRYHGNRTKKGTKEIVVVYCNRPWSIYWINYRIVFRLCIIPIGMFVTICFVYMWAVYNTTFLFLISNWNSKYVGMSLVIPPADLAFLSVHCTFVHIRYNMN